MTDDKKLLEIIEKDIAQIEYPDRAKGLYIPVEYTLKPGGKRIRPLLCLKACEAFGHSWDKALNQAVGIEMFHNFTLIHDDVMDRSDTRRGNPTVFAKWGSTQAILSGDALLTLATRKVAKCDSAILPDVLLLFNKTALEVYEGQQLDMDFEERDDVTSDEYLEMIKLKTSVLLGCSCAMGALMSRSPRTDVDALYKYGEQLGVAFQLRDDWLDTFGDSEEFGKPIGGDIRNRKKTWLFITAQNEAAAKMDDAIHSGDDEIVERVREVYNELNLSERCDRLVHNFCNNAIESLDNAGISSEAKEWFTKLALDLCSRKK